MRRAEVATLAQVSVEYLTRLEQGRDTHPSPEILAALADALRLDHADWEHLRQLASANHHRQLCRRGPETVSRTVRPSVQALLGAVRNAPAHAANRLGDLLAWNDPFDRLARPLGLLDGSRPNLTWYVFTDERARDAFPDWATTADHQVAELHRQRRGDPASDAFADRLARTVGAPFTDRWRRRPVSAPDHGVPELRHPGTGPLRLAYERLALGDDAGQWVVVQLPADAVSAARLGQLLGDPPTRLRVVAG